MLCPFQSELYCDSHIQCIHVIPPIPAQSLGRAGKDETCPWDGSGVSPRKPALSWVFALLSQTISKLLALVFLCPQVLRDMCKQGYRDALHFLKKNGKALSVCRVH